MTKKPDYERIAELEAELGLRRSVRFEAGLPRWIANFYNKRSRMLHSSLEVSAINERDAERKARELFESINSESVDYYNVGIGPKDTQ